MPSRLCYFFDNTPRTLNIKHLISIVLLKIAISKPAYSASKRIGPDVDLASRPQSRISDDPGISKM